VLYRFLDVHQPTLSQVKSPNCYLNRATLNFQLNEEADWVKLRESLKKALESQRNATRDCFNRVDRAGAYISRQTESHQTTEVRSTSHIVRKIRSGGSGEAKSRKSEQPKEEELRRRRRECFINKPTVYYYPSSRLDQARRVNSEKRSYKSIAKLGKNAKL
jgi:hypothetical protein